MQNAEQDTQSGDRSRRAFLKTTATGVGAAVAGQLGAARSAHAAGSDSLKLGLIGCGGRGSGAVLNALKADSGCKLVAMADTFADHLSDKRARLQEAGGSQVAVTDANCFVGFDAYRQLLDTDVDVVILATPPHFRPQHFKAAVDAGKHTFVEKPVAVDGPGVVSVLETAERAKQKNLAVVSGLCWRYDHGVRATVEQIRQGAVGDIVAIQVNYNTGTLWHKGDDPSWSRMEYQLRNWMYYAWLSGDHIVEQHVHTLDKAAWLMGDTYPTRAVGLGGRQQRTDSKWGHIFDHHAICFEYANGVRVYSYSRQQDGCANDNEAYVLGTKGQAEMLKHRIRGETDWRYRGAKPNMYDVEHQELMASIRSGSPINDGRYMALSTMMAIMGRMTTYSGKSLSWDQCLSSTERLGPDKYDWTDVPEPQVAVPGLTPFA